MCTESSYTYCNIGTFVGLGVEAIWCDTTYTSDTIPVFTTYAGQTGREFTPLGGGAAASSTIVASSIAASSSSVVHPTPSPTTVPQPLPTIPTPIVPTPAPAPKKSTPIGPIVGGVVGGIAVIAGVAVGIFFCIRHNNKKKTGGQPANTAYPPPAPIQHTQPQINNMYPQYHEKPPVGTQVNYAELQQPPQQYPQQSPPVAQAPQQQYAPPVSPVQNQAPQQPLSGRESVVSAISSPSSPAPPYVSTVPPVPEMAANTSHHASPINDRYEMQ